MKTLLIILLKVLEVIAGLAILYCCQYAMLLFPEVRLESLILNILCGVLFIVIFVFIIFVIWFVIKELIPSWIKLNKKLVNRILKK